MTVTSAATDTALMAEALAEAARGRYSTNPNPAVGCVLVRDGVVVGRGFHRRAGEPHAEVNAIADAGGAAAGATAYVTLEPCNHHGRTGPCAEALIDAGVRRVVYAVDDPNPGVAGGGAARLSAAGLEVERGVGAEAARDLMTAFLFRAEHGRPFIRIKLAMSLDACAALASGESQWITGPEARADVQRLRAQACAIVTGSGTVVADDPSLNVRDARFAMHGRQPDRVVLDGRLRMDADARMLRLPGVTRIMTREQALPRAAALAARGALAEALPVGDDGLDLAAVVQRLAELGYNQVLVEAGPRLAGRFVAEGRFDELVVHMAPKVLGNTARRAFDVPSPPSLAALAGLELGAVSRLGPDLALCFHPSSQS
ncbi:MAG: bifunctional diaminohydroxyphosphoribosylaminopyrimidine deaminase/5-amino-6-(5-phosphoribosylamino)uracil reductase RibD [Gammaproteobacteria bacterium]